MREQADPLEHVADPATQEMRGLSARRRPSIDTSPESGSSKRLIILSIVVLPDPDSPRITTSCPAERQIYVPNRDVRAEGPPDGTQLDARSPERLGPMRPERRSSCHVRWRALMPRFSR